MPSTRSVIAFAMVWRRPDELTAFPRESPPAARMMIVQRKLLKSSFVRMPVPKNRTRGMMAMTPMSPKKSSSWWLTHQRMIVAKVTKEMNSWTPVNLSLTGLMGTIVVPRPGLKETRRTIQIRRMDMMPTGRTMKNQTPQDGCGSMMSSATMFCGEAMGESIPPILEARAMPRMRAFDICESEGRFRSIG